MPAALGAVIGLAMGAGGLLAIDAVRRAGRTALAVRLDPYIGNSAFTPPVRSPLLDRMARLFGGEQELARMLRAAGRREEPLAFRARQLAAWAITSAALFVATASAAMAGATVPVGTSIGTAILLGAAAPLLLHGRVRSEAVRRRLRFELELPAAAGLLGVALVAGESLRSALERTAGGLHGVWGDALRTVIDETRAGRPLSDALRDLAARADVPAVTRFVDTLDLARDRGVPVAASLRAQAGDLRSQATRRLVEVAGRRQVLMLVPVVFLILPVCALFAFYPALHALEQLTP